MDPLLQVLLLCYGTFSNMPPAKQRQARVFGYVDVNNYGREYIRGRKASREAMKVVEQNMIRMGHDVRKEGWNTASRKEIKMQQYDPATYEKYLRQHSYNRGGSTLKLPDGALPWLRVWSTQHVKASQEQVRDAILLEYGVLLSLSSVRNYLKRAGITRQRIVRIAIQKFTPENIAYAMFFMEKIKEYDHVCWFDESGISKNGMQSRHNVGMGIRGAGGAYIREALQYPPNNLSVLGLIDKDGVFAVQTFTGGTDTIRVDEYFKEHAVMLAGRGVDCVIMDNCPAHRIGSLAFWLQVVGISVVFLPRYWPQWNPIEVRDCNIVFVGCNLCLTC